MTRKEIGRDANVGFLPTEEFARELDAGDPLREYRDRFCIPTTDRGDPTIYFCGNSLGLQPRSLRATVRQELDDWARLGVDGHFQAATPWYAYHEVFRETGARLVGAVPGEVVMMNSLTVNLHLMLVTFFCPQPDRHKILIDHPPFPSDLYAVKTQLRHHGLDPDQMLLTLKPRHGEHLIRHDDIEAVLDEQGREIALVLFSGVNYYSGQQMLNISHFRQRRRRRLHG